MVGRERREERTREPSLSVSLALDEDPESPDEIAEHLNLLKRGI